MKNQLNNFAIIVFILIAFSGCVTSTSEVMRQEGTVANTIETDNSEEERPSVEVLAINIAGQTKTICLTNSAIPMADVLDAVGLSLQWIESEKASFVYNDETYVFDCSNQSIYREGRNENYIIVPPGTNNGFVYSNSNNIFVDFDTMKSTLFLLGIHAGTNIQIRNESGGSN